MICSDGGSSPHPTPGIEWAQVGLSDLSTITSVEVDFELGASGVTIRARVRVTGPTGVEMEALTAAAVAGLTLIDMTKGVERGVYLESVRLLEKSGGRSGTWKRSPST